MFIIIITFLCQNLVVDKSTGIDLPQNPIIFVTGLGGTGENWNGVLDMFKTDGWPNSSLFAYDFADNLDCSDQGNINNANQIAGWVTNILSITGSNKVDMIAYSMGGISSRYYMKFLNGTHFVDDYVSIASPQHGSLGTASCDFYFDKPNVLIKMLNEGDETPGGILDDTVGDRYDGILNITYNGTHEPGNVNYTTIYSPDDNIVFPFNTSKLNGAINISLDGYLHGQIDQAMYRYIREAVYDWNDNMTTTTTTFLSSTTTKTTPTSSTTTSTQDSTPSSSPGLNSIVLLFVLCMITILRKKK